MLFISVSCNTQSVTRKNSNTFSIDNFRIGNPVSVNIEKANKKMYRTFAKRGEKKPNPISMNPQNLYVNNDGTISLLFEELYGRRLDQIAINLYHGDLREIMTYYIPKSQALNKVMYSDFYIAGRERGALELYKGNEYLSFDYISTDSANYFFFNDDEESEERLKKGQLSYGSGSTSKDAFYYKLEDKVRVKRTRMFPEPEKKNDHDMGVFPIMAYDKENDVIAVRKLENRKNMEAKIVWLRLE